MVGPFWSGCYGTMGGMYDVAPISSGLLKYFPRFLARLEGLVKVVLLTP
jgi:hypothetical protein